RRGVDRVCGGARDGDEVGRPDRDSSADGGVRRVHGGEAVLRGRVGEGEYRARAAGGGGGGAGEGDPGDRARADSAGAGVGGGESADSVCGVAVLRGGGVAGVGRCAWGGGERGRAWG